MTVFSKLNYASIQLAYRFGATTPKSCISIGHTNKVFRELCTIFDTAGVTWTRLASLVSLEEQDRLRELHVAKLRAALAEGLEQADRGETLDGGEVVKEMREFLRERRRERKSK